MTSELHGTFTAIVTPFSADGGTVDYESLRRLIEFQIAEKVDGLVVCGSTGEAATLSDEEYENVVRTACAAVKGRIPVVGGVGASSTARAVSMAQTVERAGADLVMVVAPPYNKPPQEGIIAHMREVKRAISKPLVCYNVPSRTGVNILPKTFGKMAEQGIIDAIKEASGSLDQIIETIALVGEKAPVFSGDDSLTHAVMASGGVGIISVLANVAPALVTAITGSALAGCWEKARDAQLAALPLCRAMFVETNPIPVKTALAIKGVIQTPAVRLPLVAAEPNTVEKLKSLLV